MSSGKKILLITFSSISDHQDKVVVLYEEMRKAGENVFIILPEHIDVKCEHSSRTWFVKCPERPGLTKGTFNIKDLFSLIWRIKREKFDIIFFETLHTWNLPIIFLSGTNTSIYQMIHDVIPHSGDKTAKQVALMNQVVCMFADKIIICNAKYQGELSERYGIDKDKVLSINLWERFPKYNQTNRSGHALFFGRLNPYKGANNLLKIARLCPNIKFDIVGKADERVREVLEDLKKLPNVHVDERYVADIEIGAIFSKCEWIILPYNSATQSGVVVEAYKNSKPVVSFDVGAISEQIINGVTGFLIEQGNTEEFAHKLNQLFGLSNDEYHAFCLRAYQYGFEQFSVVNAYTSLFTPFASDVSIFL